MVIDMHFNFLTQHRPSVSTTSLQKGVFVNVYLSAGTTPKVKHCRYPIVVMRVVDKFGYQLVACSNMIWAKLAGVGGLDPKILKCFFIIIAE